MRNVNQLLRDVIDHRLTQEESDRAYDALIAMGWTSEQITEETESLRDSRDVYAI